MAHTAAIPVDSGLVSPYVRRGAVLPIDLLRYCQTRIREIGLAGLGPWFSPPAVSA